MGSDQRRVTQQRSRTEPRWESRPLAPGPAPFLRPRGEPRSRGPCDAHPGPAADPQPPRPTASAEPEARRERWEQRQQARRRPRPRRLHQRSVSREKWVETLVVADAKMVEYHGQPQVESYVLTIMNMVSLRSVRWVVLEVPAGRQAGPWAWAGGAASGLRSPGGPGWARGVPRRERGPC